MTNNIVVPIPKVVTVFGSSKTDEGTAGYQEAFEVGRLLALAGFTVCNGGFDGTMEATARGAKSVGGRTVGVTVGIFPARYANRWLDREVKETTLFLRLERLINLADAFVVLRGGVGTLVELMLVWNLKQASALGRKPILLLGSHWRQVLATLRNELVITEEDVALLTAKDTPTEAVDWLHEQLERTDAIDAATSRDGRGKA